MADLYFYRSLETLAWPSFGGHWKAKSGPWGLGELPPGLYTVGRREITDYTSAIDNAYKDKTTGQGFFVPIYPQFLQAVANPEGLVSTPMAMYPVQKAVSVWLSVIRARSGTRFAPRRPARQ